MDSSSDRAKYPWLAFLRADVDYRRMGTPFCSASIIDNKHLLTTASCVFELSASSLHLQIGTEGEVDFKENVEQIFIHPMYSFYAKVKKLRNFVFITLL